MKPTALLASLAVLAAAIALTLRAEERLSVPKPLRALLVIGGCCHDYAKQKEILKAGLEARAHLEVDVLYTDDSGTHYRFAEYENPEWAKGYDVVIHDECTADVKDPAFVENIVAAHRDGVPAVNLHCAMHSYRVGTFNKPVEPGTPDALWFDFLGLQSSGHGPQEPIAITFADRAHPVTKGLEGWTTGKEELYNNHAVFPTAHVLARGQQGNSEAVVVWTNQYGPKKTRVFSTTLGHNNETVADDRYLDLVARGLLWATAKLTDDGRPAPGYAPLGTAK
ncbi:MAG: ThuA domain-containing protein [Verrucomicrobiales bacterium]